MTEHQKLMLVRHLERAVRSYEAQADELLSMPGNDFEVTMFAQLRNTYLEHAADARAIIGKIYVGKVHVQN